MRIKLDESVDFEKFKEEIKRTFPGSQNFELKSDGGQNVVKFATSASYNDIINFLKSVHEKIKKYPIKELTMSGEKEPEVIVEKDDAQKVAEHENILIEQHRKLAKDEAQKVVAENIKKIEMEAKETIESISSVANDLDKRQREIIQNIGIMKQADSYAKDELEKLGKSIEDMQKKQNESLEAINQKIMKINLFLNQLLQLNHQELMKLLLGNYHHNHLQHRHLLLRCLKLL